VEPVRFKGPAAYIADLDRSRAFYEGLLGLTVLRVMSRGEQPIAVAYTAGLSIWLATDAYAALFGDAGLAPQHLRGGNWENTFETDTYEEIYARLLAAGAEFLYEPRTLPWGQRGFRVYDPDGHILDISETMTASVRRQAAEGKPLEQISATSGFTLDVVQRMVQGDSTPA
jgi:catechol 2,3-dioxygenase-like lactoylglutathione lyase family enzyme